MLCHILRNPRSATKHYSLLKCLFLIRMDCYLLFCILTEENIIITMFKYNENILVKKFPRVSFVNKSAVLKYKWSIHPQGWNKEPESSLLSFVAYPENYCKDLLKVILRCAVLRPSLQNSLLKLIQCHLTKRMTERCNR